MRTTSNFEKAFPKKRDVIEIYTLPIRVPMCLIEWNILCRNLKEVIVNYAVAQVKLSHKSASVPQLKAKSAQLLMEAEQDVAERERQLKERLDFASDMMLEADAKEQYADQQLAEAAAAQAAAKKRTSELDEREADISAKAKKQDEREKEFQKWEDALDAQRSVVEERERAVSVREQKNQELIQRGRRAQAEDLSDSIQPEEHNQRRLPDLNF